MITKASIKKLINEKMRLLSDFKVCEYDDDEMRKKLLAEIERRSNVNPQIVLESYCKPLIKEAMNNWK